MKLECYFFLSYTAGEAPTAVGYINIKKTNCTEDHSPESAKVLQEEKESKTSYLGSSERARRKPTRFEHYLPN